MPKQAWEPLESYQEFPTFATQDDAAKVNAPGARDYVAEHDDKHWFDPDPADGRDGKFTFDLSGVPHVFYPRVVTGAMSPDGSGRVTSLVIPVVQAAKVNIIPTGPNTTNWPATGKSVPVPMLPFGAEQKLLKPNPFSPFMVRNTDVPLPADEAGLTPVMAAINGLRVQVDKILAKLGIA